MFDFVPRSDKDYVQRQYTTGEALAIRIRTHDLYCRPKIHFPAVVLEQIAWTGREVVIDVGCGTGAYLPEARHRGRFLVAGDLSLGMLSSLEGDDQARVNLDARRLPFAGRSADVLLANHMLYHVRLVQTALAEFSRVLQPGGTLLAATNSANTMAEFLMLQEKVLDRLGVSVDGSGLEPSRMQDDLLNSGFTLENGQAQLACYFGSVRRVDIPSALVFDEPEPVLAYIGTLGGRLAGRFPCELGWDTFMEAARLELTEHIARHGAFTVHKSAGVFICRKGQ